MAFIFKQPNSSYWYAGWKDEKGKRRNRSTKLKNVQGNRRQAKKIAEAFEEHSKKQRSFHQVRETIEELNQELTGKKLPRGSFSEYGDLFLIHKKAESSESTVTHYRNIINTFSEWLGEGHTDLNELTSEDLVKFREELLDKVSSSTVNKKMKGLRALFTAAIRDGYMSLDPTQGMKFNNDKHGSESHNRKVFTIEQIKLILNKCSAEWVGMVKLGLYTGQRLGDLAKLRWSNIDLPNKILSLKTGKTSRLVKIPIGKSLEEYLNGLPKAEDPEDYLHPKLAGHYIKSGSAILSNQFTKILEHAKLRKPSSHKSTGKGRDGRRADSQLSFHSLRVTAVSMLHEANVPAAIAQEWVGHDSEEVHRVYVKMGKESLKKASDALPDLD